MLPRPDLPDRRAAGRALVQLATGWITLLVFAIVVALGSPLVAHGHESIALGPVAACGYDEAYGYDVQANSAHARVPSRVAVQPAGQTDEISRSHAISGTPCMPHRFEAPTSTPAPRYVYRGGSDQPMNMTPRPGVDSTGLSTFDNLEAAVKPGGKAQVIDTTKLKCVAACPDAPPPGHVSLAPRNAAEIPEWAATRGTDTVHPYTQDIIDAIVDTVRRPK